MEMKKVVMFICLLMSSLGIIKAQKVINGTVTDNDGNPIPGVRVELVGTDESVITELDGTFSFQTDRNAEKVKVMYSGMQTKVQTIKPDMVVKMTKTTWWNRVPEKYSWVVSPQIVFPEKGCSKPAFGLMVARVKVLGYYAKFVYSPSENTSGDYPVGYDILPWTTGKDKRGYMAGTVGVMYRLMSPVHVYAGLGYVDCKVAWQIADGSYMKNPDLSYSGVVADYGLMLRVGKFTLNGGAMMGMSDGCKFAINAGIGYSF